MTIENWSEQIIVGELQDDPAFTDDMTTVLEQVQADPNLNVVLNFAGVHYLNSSNIAKLLRLRRSVIVTNQRKLKLCAVGTQVWGLFLVTGLDKVFDFVDSVAEALASVQIERR